MALRRHGVILAIIVLCGGLFFLEQVWNSRFEYGAVPAEVVAGGRAVLEGEVTGKAVPRLARLATAVFLHADFEHLLLNMIFLWAFGSLIAQLLGQGWALAIFLATGVCGNLVQVWLDPESTRSIIGASGAVCGFQGAYLGLALGWRLPWPDVWPLAHPIPSMQLAAFGAVGVAVDIFMLSDRGQGIAFGAHVGGFLAGLALAAAITTIYRSYDAFARRRRAR